MRNLLWKEWHEQSWKLAFGSIVLGALVLIGLHARIIADETMSMWACALGVLLLPLFAGTGLIPAERAEGSFESLIAMPIAPQRILLAKSVIGMLLCVGPLAVALLVTLLMAGNREVPLMDTITLYERSALAAVSLFFWMLALTSRLPSEARAGMVAVGVLICWLIVTLGLNQPSVPRMFFAITPFAFVYDLENQMKSGPSVWITVVFQMLTITLLWLCTVPSFRTSDATRE